MTVPAAFAHPIPEVFADVEAARCCALARC
jgi:hypothetical protein